MGLIIIQVAARTLQGAATSIQHAEPQQISRIGSGDGSPSNFIFQNGFLCFEEKDQIIILDTRTRRTIDFHPLQALASVPGILNSRKMAFVESVNLLHCSHCILSFWCDVSFDAAPDMNVLIAIRFQGNEWKVIWHRIENSDLGQRTSSLQHVVRNTSDAFIYGRGNEKCGVKFTYHSLRGDPYTEEFSSKSMTLGEIGSTMCCEIVDSTFYFITSKLLKGGDESRNPKIRYMGFQKSIAISGGVRKIYLFDHNNKYAYGQIKELHLTSHSQTNDPVFIEVGYVLGEWLCSSRTLSALSQTEGTISDAIHPPAWYKGKCDERHLFGLHAASIFDMSSMSLLRIVIGSGELLLYTIALGEQMTDQTTATVLHNDRYLWSATADERSIVCSFYKSPHSYDYYLIGFDRVDMSEMEAAEKINFEEREIYDGRTGRSLGLARWVNLSSN